MGVETQALSPIIAAIAMQRIAAVNRVEAEGAPWRKMTEEKCNKAIADTPVGEIPSTYHGVNAKKFQASRKY